MSVIYIALPAAIALVTVAVAAFLWAARQGQFDDLDSPAARMLDDDEDNGPSRE